MCLELHVSGVTCVWSYQKLLDPLERLPCSGPSEGQSDRPSWPSVGLRPIPFCPPPTSWGPGLVRCTQGAFVSEGLETSNNYLSGSVIPGRGVKKNQRKKLNFIINYDQLLLIKLNFRNQYKVLLNPCWLIACKFNGLHNLIRNKAHHSAEREDGYDHLRNIPAFEEVRGLEDLLVGDAIFLHRFLESGEQSCTKSLIVQLLGAIFFSQNFNI